MGFKVKEMLDMTLFENAKLLGGENGMENDIQGVTIIEAPDIVRFINGGEVLLTSFYAFQSCTPEEFQGYLNELTKKKISAVAVKRGRNVEYMEEKLKLLLAFADTHQIPVVEIPFSLSFRDILKEIMERLSNEEVIRLKYFKTTHDNFTALSLSQHSVENGIKRILKVLEKLIGNPVALFNQQLDCLVTTDARIQSLTLTDQLKEYTPEIYSSHIYLQQTACIDNEEKEYRQYLVRLNVMYNAKMYLVITECGSPLTDMDYIAVENAVTALRQELFRQQSITELEKKFQNDVMNNILNGKLNSRQELQRDIRLLGIPLDGVYRVIVFNLIDEKNGEPEDINDKVKYVNMLYNAIHSEFTDVKIQNDMDRVIVIQEIKKEQRSEEYRKTLMETVKKVQKRVSAENRYLRVRAGAGKEVEGVWNIPDSFKEAGDALMFIDILGEDNTDHLSRVMLFSDMGIFKLLCQLDDAQSLLEYVPESLQKLYNYKKQQRQDLLITLKTYLDHNQNLTRTAQDLFIHYKTAAYRIERITEITGIDFDNPSEVLAIRIGLVVYKMIENLQK